MCVLQGITRRSTTHVLVAGTVVLLTACYDDAGTPPTGPGFGPSTSVAQVAQETTPTQEQVAAVVPGFGGYFLAFGRPTVYLTDVAQRPLAEQALAGFFADRGFVASDLVVRQANHSYDQLAQWYEASWRAALAVSGAAWSDLDEGNNRLRFAGVDAAAVAGIAAAVAAAGVPAGAFTVETGTPIQQLVTLRDRVRPVPGGYQINFFPTPVSPLTLVCTLGFNVLKNNVKSFITNSHCTNVQGGAETPTDYYQPVRGTPPIVTNFIGVEVEDPHYEMVGCTQDFGLPAQCRYSDASRAAYAAGVPFELGRIARTTEAYQDTPRDPNAFPPPPVGDDRVPVLTVDPLNPSFRINGESKVSVLGEVANKVGRTTGWTFGPITQTCLNSVVLGTVPPIIQRCQDRVRADVAGGDSGSPVFRRLGNGANVRLLGILWGGSVLDGEQTFVFSPMHGVRRELGNFVTH